MQMQGLVIGMASFVGIAGDPINGSSFRDIPERFAAEPAACLCDHMIHPVAACIAGLAAPKGRQMSQAGATPSASGESAA